MMMLYKKLNSIFLLTFLFFCFGCQSKNEKTSEELRDGYATHDKETNQQPNTFPEETNETKPVTCIDWIGYYGDGTRELDSKVRKTGFKVKREGYDEYGSANKLKGAYVLKDKNMPIDKIGKLAKYLAYKLCLSDNKKFNGILMDCQSRKIQVVIARNEKNYNNEAWAVVYNVYPANKKGELIILDNTK